jgi:hypothetical protein
MCLVGDRIIALAIALLRGGFGLYRLITFVFFNKEWGQGRPRLIHRHKQVTTTFFKKDLIELTL